MGVTFLGNPFDQDNDFDSDLEMTGEEELILPPQEIVFINRPLLDPSIVPDDSETELEDDADPNWTDSNDGESDEYFNLQDVDFYNFEEDEDDDYEEEELEYVTYPLPLDEQPAEADKPTASDTTNPDENNDVD